LLCPLQNVFTSTTHRSLPLNNWRKTNYINNLWDLTFNENGWSNLETTKWFVHKICYHTLIHNWKIEFVATSYNDLITKLLICTQEQGISRLDEKRSLQHLGHFHINKLHKWITTCKCNFAMTTKAWFQSGVQYMDYISHQITRTIH
jgi:hypothetical protein